MRDGKPSTEKSTELYDIPELATFRVSEDFVRAQVQQRDPYYKVGKLIRFIREEHQLAPGLRDEPCSSLPRALGGPAESLLLVEPRRGLRGMGEIAS